MNLRKHPAWRAVLFWVVLCVCAGCESHEPKAGSFSNAGAGGRGQSHRGAQEGAGVVQYAKIVKDYGSVAPLRKRFKLGAVLKYLGNPYDQLVADGMHAEAARLGLFIDIQAGLSESDHEGQRAVLEAAIRKGYDAILISPQTDNNLRAAVSGAREHGILLINVDNARLSDADYFIGPDQYQSGILAARVFIDHIGHGGKVAVLSGFKQDYGAERRIRGLEDTLKEAKATFEIVARRYCFRDFQIALQNAAQLLDEYPDLVGFFCGSDIMALGADQAVKAARKTGHVLVVGRDGINQAVEAARNGGITATVDIRPFDMGHVAVAVAARILMGEKIASVVVTPQQVAGDEKPGNGAQEKQKTD